MKKKKCWKNKIFIISAAMLLSLVFIAPRADAQFGPYYNPLFGFGPFGYFPILPSTSPLLASAVYRYANVPTTASLFPAPTLPPVPAATIGGVGVTPLIPSVTVSQPVPLSVLNITPLAPLITYTPLSLVGLTFAPVPVSAAPAPAPLTPILPVTVPTTTTSVTVGPSTTAALISLLSSLIL